MAKVKRAKAPPEEAKMASFDEAAREPRPEPEPSDMEVSRMWAAHARVEGRHTPVSIRADMKPGGGIDLGPPYSDVSGWVMRLMDSVGTASDDFALAQLRHLVQMMPKSETAPSKNLNAMVASVDAVRPENETEGMLAVQMAAVHHFAMTCLSHASTASTIQQRETAGNMATKMLRTFTTQLEALAKLRRGGEQKVRVEHVHVYPGGQAIVGNVEQAGGGGRLGNGHQPHALTGTAALALSDGGAVLREDAKRGGVPVASRKRQEPVPDARRSDRKRRANG